LKSCHERHLFLLVFSPEKLCSETQAPPAFELRPLGMRMWNRPLEGAIRFDLSNSKLQNDIEKMRKKKG
jgi:hypothetical protein